MGIVYEQREQQLQGYPFENLMFQEHLHKETEVILIQEGSLNMKTENLRQTLHAGDIAIIFPNQMHSYHTETYSKGHLIVFGMQMAGDYEGMLTGYHCPEPWARKQRMPADIPMCMKSLMREDLADKPALMRGYTAVLLGNLFDLLPLEKNTQPREHTALNLILRFIANHYREPITLDDISAQTGIGKYTISRIFSQELHYSFTQYLNSMRIGYAQHLLGSHQLSITDAAFESGFSSLRTFNRVFRAIHGMSPREYREGLGH